MKRKKGIVKYIVDVKRKRAFMSLYDVGVEHVIHAGATALAAAIDYVSKASDIPRAELLSAAVTAIKKCFNIKD